MHLDDEIGERCVNRKKEEAGGGCGKSDEKEPWKFCCLVRIKGLSEEYLSRAVEQMRDELVTLRCLEFELSRVWVSSVASTT